MSLLRRSGRPAGALLAVLLLMGACDDGSTPEPSSTDETPRVSEVDRSRAEQRYRWARDNLRAHLLGPGSQACTPAYRAESLRGRADALLAEIEAAGARVDHAVFVQATRFKADVQTIRTVAASGPDRWIDRASALRRELGRTVHALDDAFARAQKTHPDRAEEIDRRRMALIDRFQQTTPAWDRLRRARAAAPPRDCLTIGQDVGRIRSGLEAAKRMLDAHRRFLNTL